MRLSQTLNIALVLIDKAVSNNIQLRLIGLIGIVALVKEKKGYAYIKKRRAKDIDFIIENRADMHDVIKIFQAENYEFDREVLLYSEGKRCIFKHRESNITVDVIVNPFEFSHRIDFLNRFAIEINTLSVTDLFLTKVQRVFMRNEDILDIKALLCSFDVTQTDEKNISLSRLNEVCSANWGLYYTVMKNLEKIALDSNFSLKKKNQIIQNSLSKHSKTFHWQVRSIFGSKFKYYEDVNKL